MRRKSHDVWYNHDSGSYVQGGALSQAIMQRRRSTMTSAHVFCIITCVCFLQHLQGQPHVLVMNESCVSSFPNSACHTAHTVALRCIETEEEM